MGQRGQRTRRPLPVPAAVSIDGIGDLAGADLGPGGLGRDTVHARQYGGRPGVCVFASSDRTPHGRLLHVSLSFADRDPTWAELKAVRSAFFPPDVDVAQILPRTRDYVNFATRAFHLWEIPGEWGIGKDGMI
jgi:hypothetical protein